MFIQHIWFWLNQIFDRYFMFLVKAALINWMQYKLQISHQPIIAAERMLLLIFLNITLFLMIFSEGEGTIGTQSIESATLQMINNATKTE